MIYIIITIIAVITVPRINFFFYGLWFNKKFMKSFTWRNIFCNLWTFILLWSNRSVFGEKKIYILRHLHFNYLFKTIQRFSSKVNASSYYHGKQKINHLVKYFLICNSKVYMHIHAHYHYLKYASWIRNCAM